MTSKKNIALILICSFLLSLIIRFIPVWHKGYSFSPFGGNLALARNYSVSGKYEIENDKNVFLSSVNIDEKGISCNWGNQTTAVLYGWIFKIFGFNANLPIYISLIIWSLISSILFLLVLKLFNLKIAIIFGVVDIFMPFIMQGALMPGFYEWAVLFFVIALVFFLYKENVNLGELFFVGVFIGLATLARNAFLVSFPSFIVYDFWKNKSWKRILVLILPFVLIFGSQLFLGYINGSTNTYLSSQDTSFGVYGHMFPDPYTFHFEKEEFINKLIKSPDVTSSAFLLKYGYKISIKDKVIRYLRSIFFFPKEFIKLVISGGPLIILLMIIGAIYLYREKIYLFKFASIWIVLLYIGLIYLMKSNWDHFLEIGFLIVLLTALGIYWLIELILKSKIKYKYLAIIVMLGAILIHLGQANKWMLHEEYNTSNIEMVVKLSTELNKYDIDKKQDIIAVGLHTIVAQSLNYYNDCNIIYFDYRTISKLLDDNKLDWAFDQFGVNKIIGFNEEISQRIVDQTGVVNIYSLK